MFSQLYKLLKQNNYPKTIRDIVQHLESLIMDNDLYEYIRPEKHYSLIHGDYNPRNSKLKKQDQSIKVFDWETFKIGPRFIDVARYLSGALIEYSDVKEIYLDDKELGGKLSLIEKIFFLYALI